MSVDGNPPPDTQVVLAQSASSGADEARHREILDQWVQAHDLLDAYGVPRFERVGGDRPMHEHTLSERLQVLINRVRQTLDPVEPGTVRMVTTLRKRDMGPGPCS